MVCAPQEHVLETVVHRGARKLGNRIFRIHDSGSGKPDRLYPAVTRPAQNIAGGHHPFRIRAVFHSLHEGRIQAGFHLGGTLSRRRSLFYVPHLKNAKLALCYFLTAEMADDSNKGRVE